GCLCEHNVLCVEYVIRSDLQVRKELNIAQVPRGKPKVRVLLMIDNQDPAIEAQLCQYLREWLCLVTLEREGVDNVQLICFEFLGKRRFQSCAEHLLRQRGLVVARPRTEYGAALAPERVSDFSNARSACTFLAPGFLAAAAYFGASL